MHGLRAVAASEGPVFVMGDGAALGIPIIHNAYSLPYTVPRLMMIRTLHPMRSDRLACTRARTSSSDAHSITIDRKRHSLKTVEEEWEQL